MESDGETAKEGGGGVTSVRNFLSGSGPGSITFWVGDLVFVWGNIPGSGGGACGIPKADNWEEGSAAEGRNLEKCDIREVP